MNSLIRPLEWVKSREHGTCWVARTAFGDYLAWEDGVWQAPCRLGGAGTDSLADAQLAAKSHFNDLVGRCLVPVPDDCVVHRGVVRKVLRAEPVIGSDTEVLYVAAASARTKEEA